MVDNTVGGIIELYDIEGDDSLKEFPKEDDTEISFNWNKQDGIPDEDHPKFFKEKRLQDDITEDEKDVLKCNVRLDDGMLGEVVTCFMRGEVWFYYCHPCLKEVEGWENLKEHGNSKEHKVVLAKAAHARNKFNTKHINEKLTEEITDLDLIPCEIQPKLDEYDKPLIGLEYLVESKTGFKGFGSDPQYYCLLCDKLGNDKTILVHLSSKKHYLKYFLMFFPTALEKLKQFATVHAKITDLVNAVIEHVVARIETEYGRLVPQQVERDSFDGLKFKILSAIDSSKHIRETKELTFEECVCLTHLHLSVCEVIPYQKKWIKEEIKKWKEEEEEEVEKEGVDGKPKAEKTRKRFKKKSTFPSITKPVFKKKDVSASTSNLINRTDDYFKINPPALGSSNVSFKRQQWQSQKKQGNTKFSTSNQEQIAINKINTDNRRDSPDSGYNYLTKRTKFTQGVPYSQPSMSSQNVQSKVWESSNNSNYGPVLKNTRISPLMNPNVNYSMPNNINIPIAKNAMPNNPVRSTFPNLYENSQINEAVRNFAAEGLNKAAIVQNMTNTNIQQKLFHLANPNQMKAANPSIIQIHAQKQKPNSNRKAATNKYQTISANNYQTVSTNNYKTNSNQKQINRRDSGRSNIQSHNIIRQNNFTKSPVLLSKNQPNMSTLPKNFNNVQSMTRMPPPGMMNSSNVQQLNPVAFNNQSQFMAIPPPQRFNFPISNQFNQQMNNFRKF